MFNKPNYLLRKKSFKRFGTNVPYFTLRWVTFKKGMSSDDVKDIVRRDMKQSKAKLRDEYDVIYAKASKAGRGDSLRTEYSICVKPFANTIFVIPKKHRKEARKAISELFVGGNQTL